MKGTCGNVAKLKSTRNGCRAIPIGGSPVSQLTVVIVTPTKRLAADIDGTDGASNRNLGKALADSLGTANIVPPAVGRSGAGDSASLSASRIQQAKSEIPRHGQR